MLQAYRDLLAQLKLASPFETLTLQYTFIFYLVLGQFVVLLLWRLLAPARRGNVGFALYLLLAQAVLLAAWPWLIGAWQLGTLILLADLVVTVHLALVVGVLLGLLLIGLGGPLGWGWVRNFWFRLIQLLVIEVVAGQAVVGIECPLKTLERMLRVGGGADGLHDLEGASAIGAFCNDLLYQRGEPVVFLAIYTLVALLVLLTWVLVPPRLPWKVDKETPKRAESGQDGPGWVGEARPVQKGVIQEG